MPKHGDKRENKTDDPVIVSSLAFNSKTKISSDSLCPTILILPYPTLSNGEFLKILFSMREPKKRNSVLVFQSWKMTLDHYSDLITLQVFQKTAYLLIIKNRPQI